jgi:hypothetical protein
MYGAQGNIYQKGNTIFLAGKTIAVPLRLPQNSHGLPAREPGLWWVASDWPLEPRHRPRDQSGSVGSLTRRHKWTSTSVLIYDYEIRRDTSDTWATAVSEKPASFILTCTLMKKAAGTSESLIYRTWACLNSEDLKPKILRFQTPHNFVCTICPVFVLYTVRLSRCTRRCIGE